LEQTKPNGLIINHLGVGLGTNVADLQALRDWLQQEGNYARGDGEHRLVLEAGAQNILEGALTVYLVIAK
jgi:hypothetical protein